MQKKKGISLIVLVITIIVMIILAAAVVITLSNTGIINRASDAVTKTNKQEVVNLASLIWAEEFMSGKRGNTLKTDVLAKLEDYKEDYNIIVTDEGVTVKDKTEGGWTIAREYDENGLITKAVVTDGTVSYEIGTTVNYMPDGVGATSYKGGWKLLGVDDEGRLLIMSNDSITGSAVQLNGKDDYINGLTTLQNAVNGYKDGTIGVDVRSVKVEDIDAVTGYDPDTFTGEEYLQALVDMYKMMGMEGTDAEIEAAILSEFGITTKDQMSILDNGMQVTYSWDGTAHPKYSYIKNGVTTTGNLLNSHSSNGFTYYDSTTNTFKTANYTTTAGTIVTVKNDIHSYIGPLKYTEDSKAYQMLFMTADGSNTSTYWLASRYAYANPYYVGFSMRHVSDGGLGSNDLVGSDDYTSSPSHAVRAVVTLASGISLKDSATKIGTYDIVE